MSYRVLGQRWSHAHELVDIDHEQNQNRKPLNLVTSQAIRDESTENLFGKDIKHRGKARFFPSSWARRQHGREAWRFVVASGALTGGIVLLINVTFIVVILTRFEVDDYSAVIYRGSCSTSSNTVIGLHILINVLSMILLSCSNYSMQCLSSPSRSEIDHAHARRRWLSVGVQSVRNLFFISKIKSLLWILLALSSVPLHLLWNSTIFQTLTANNYIAISVTENFLSGASWSSFANSDVDEAVEKLQRAAGANQLVRLGPADCIRAYAQPMQHNRRDVLLVSAISKPPQLNGTSTSAFAAYSDAFVIEDSTTFSWMCNDSISLSTDGGVWQCDVPLLESFAATSANHWIPGGRGTGETISLGNQQNLTVAYCLSEVVPEQCTVNVVPLFLGIVIACNAVKIAAFLATLYVSQKYPPLVTTGDAIHSFLERPDPVTAGRCLVSKQDYETFFRRSREWEMRAPDVADIWDGGRVRWGKAARWYTWWAFALPAALVVIMAGSLYGPDGEGDGTTETWPIISKLGIGIPQPNFDMTIGASVNLITATLTANSPQLIVTYIYLFYNNLMTTMLMMAEWCKFASLPAKGLRVSKPSKKTAQRATYYLQIPYRYSIPSTVLIATLHWLVSQMVFVAAIDVYDLQGSLIPANNALDSTGSITSVFFSPLAMLIAVPLASALLIVLFAVAIFAKYPGNIPLSAGCSASLAAACQPGRGQAFSEGLSSRRLVWGVTESATGVAGVGHATFSDASVEKLVEGGLYS